MIRVVCGILVREGRTLAARRGPGMRNPGHWEFPGGKVEPGESDEAALVRELREELGIDVSVGALVARCQRDPIDLLAYLCTTSDEPHPTEHDRISWFAPSELMNLHMTSHDREVSEIHLSSFQAQNTTMPATS